MKNQKKSVAFLTLGCKVNSYETNAMKRLFQEAGYEIADFSENADIYVVNTCTVTNMADRKSRQMLHRAKKRNPKGVLVAVGCYVQAAKEELQKESTIDLIVGNNQKHKIVEIVEAFFQSSNQNLLLDVAREKDFEPLFIESAGEKTRAYIKIQDGCNQFCSYCIIPYARGLVRSRKAEVIIQEVDGLVKRGYKEVVLTGIHLSSYGVDLEPWKEKSRNMNFLELKGEPLVKIIKDISEIDGLERIRLGSLEPRFVTEDVIKSLSNIKKVCPHFHLSLQSGCDSTLRRMNRKYTCSEYLEKCQIIRSYYSHPAITTDVIVGFPGETEEEFLNTKEFVRKAEFAQMHIFKYSPRKGTLAEKMDDQIEEAVKTQRSGELLNLEKEMRRSYQQFFLDKIEHVLFEDIMTIQGKSYQIGHNERYLTIGIPFDQTGENLENQIIPVKILSPLDETLLIGERESVFSLKNF